MFDENDQSTNPLDTPPQEVPSEIQKRTRKVITGPQFSRLAKAAAANREHIVKLDTLKAVAEYLSAATGLAIWPDKAKEVLESEEIPLPAKPEKPKGVDMLSIEVEALKQRVAHLEANQGSPLTK